MEILFADNHVIAASKPAGIPTQPSDGHKDSFEGRVKQWLREKDGKTGNVFLHALHRLDTPVSGAVLFAKTDKALSRLNASMRDKKHKKIYLAVVEGVFKNTKGTLSHHHSHMRFMARITDKPHEGSKEAVLSYEVKAVDGGRSLVEVTLDTGRYHQIRAQLAHIGHPIFGDEKYGSRNRMDNGAIALHHYRMAFVHPVSKEFITVTAPLPDAFPFSRFSEQDTF
ncbi:RluA family pseudouridine synthase [Seleniivibrio woodruffii]|uniref:RluA family pseudouridine synthase n=1 Tax=Seleniivibrio woodruffii TaxID=1078050 RepID=UPI0026EDADA7|nr:RluA family pseudouridine synthase [Seleniivibrio woodruffii]